MIDLDTPMLQEIAERARDPRRFKRWSDLTRQARYCERPIRLKGSVCDQSGSVIYTTACEPDGVLLKACGTRKESVCKPCSRVYKGDTWQLIEAGLRGGKSVPDSVARHPMLFVTLTAPSFGAVHQSQGGRRHSGVCLPRRDADECEHGVTVACWHRHSEHDEAIGQPICANCFDYDNAIMWNACAPELWRRTTIYVRRALANLLGIPRAKLGREIRLSFFKVAEYQRRGALHFHAIFRLDAARPREHATEMVEPQGVSVDDLRKAIGDGVGKASAPPPSLEFRVIRWGEQLDIRVIADRDGSVEKAAAYIAKYVTVTSLEVV